MNTENSKLPEISIKDKLRFISKIGKTSGCWFWCGSKIGEYGRFWLVDSNKIASRVSYLIYKGIDPLNEDVCHLCNNPICVNPDHLFLGTPSDNLQHASMCGRTAQQKGSQNHESKLTEAQVVEIKAALIFDYPQPDLAKKYNVDVSLISQIKRGISWKHV